MFFRRPAPKQPGVSAASPLPDSKFSAPATTLSEPGGGSPAPAASPSKTAATNFIRNWAIGYFDVIASDGRPLQIVLTQTAPQFGAIPRDEAELASALGVEQADLGPLSKQVVSTGVPHMLVHLRDRAAIGRAKPDVARLASLLRQAGGQGCYLFRLDPVIARFFNPVPGIPEDPATGSAAGPLAAFLIANKVIDAETVVVEQGHALGRASRIEIHVRGDKIEIAGRRVVSAHGFLTALSV